MKQKIVNVRLGDVWPNPYRDIQNYELDEHKVESLMESIESTGFWANVIGRMKDGYFELAYGHHRLEAAIRVLGENYVHPFAVADLPDYMMLQIMANENRDDWGNSTKHNNLTVEQGRDFLDNLLDQYPTWEEAAKAAEFGGLSNLECWFGTETGQGGNGPANYNQCVKNGVGREVLVHFFNWKKTDVEYALRQIDPSDKQLAKLKEEQVKADAALKEAQEEVKRRQKAAKKAGHELKAGIVDSKLVKAQARKEKAEKQLAGYDPDAGKLFAKPVHADAFKSVVTSPTFRKYLPESKQKAFAKKVLSACGGEVTAKDVREKAWALLQKEQPKLRDFEDKGSPWEALETRVSNAADRAKSLDGEMKSLIAEINRAGIKSLSGDQATRLSKNLDSLMERVALFYDIFGMEPPMVEIVKSDGKTTNLRVVK